MDTQHKRSIQTLQQMKLEKLISTLLVPNNHPNNQHLSDQWTQIGTTHRQQLINFIFNHPINSIHHNNTYNSIPIPSHFQPLIHSSHTHTTTNSLPPNQINKKLTIRNITQFCNTPSGENYKKKRVKLNEFEFQIHLYPNGLSPVQNGYVQFFIELTKMPSHIKSIIVFVNLLCRETNTSHKRTKMFYEADDSEGWIWSLKIDECQQYNTLQFVTDIKLLQIRHKNTNKIFELLSENDRFQIEPLTEYKWQYNDIKYILNEIKYLKHPSVWYSNNTPNNMFCFGIESDGNYINILCNLLKLPIGVKEIVILFTFKMGYPKYPNTFILNYKYTQCKLKLIPMDIQWLLNTEHTDLDFIFTVQIKQICMRNNNRKLNHKKQSKQHVFKQCWYDLNNALNKYYEYCNRKLGDMFLNFISDNKWNNNLSLCIIKGEYNRKWDILYFDNNFPIPNGILFNNDREKYMFIGYVFEYCYVNKRAPHMKDMQFMIGNIRSNDMSVQIRERYMWLKEEEQRVCDIEMENKQRMDRINTLENDISTNEYEITQMLMEIERRKEVICKKTIMVEREERDACECKKDIKKRKRKLELERDVYEGDIRERDVWGKDKMCVNDRKREITLGMERWEKLKGELVECVKEREERGKECNGYVSEEIKDHICEVVSDVKCDMGMKVGSSDCNPYLDKELLNGCEVFSPDKNKQFEEKYNKGKDKEIGYREDIEEDNGSEECVIEEVMDEECDNANEEVICDEYNGMEECDKEENVKMDVSNSEEINNNLKSEMNGKIIESEVIVEEIKEEIMHGSNENMDETNENILETPNKKVLNDIQTEINDTETDVLNASGVDLIVSHPSESPIIGNNIVFTEVSSCDSSPKNICTKVIKMGMNFMSSRNEPISESAKSEQIPSQSNCKENKKDESLHANNEIWKKESNKYFEKVEQLTKSILYSQQFNILIKARKDVQRLYNEYIEDKRANSKNKENRFCQHSYYVLMVEQTHVYSIINDEIAFIENLRDIHQQYIDDITPNNTVSMRRDNIRGWKQRRYNCNNLIQMLNINKTNSDTTQLLDLLQRNEHNEMKQNNEIRQNNYQIFTDEQMEIIEKKMQCSAEVKFHIRNFELLLDGKASDRLQYFRTIQRHKNQYDVQQIIADINNGKLNKRIKELMDEGKLFVDVGKKQVSNSFRNCSNGKKFKKEKCEINGFQFKIYLLPNVGNNCVQFEVKLAQVPIGIESVVIYLQLYEKKTKTDFHKTHIFSSCSGCEIGWGNTQLSMKECLNYKKLQFGYKIQILRIFYNDMKPVNDCCKDGLFGVGQLNWNWQIDKNIILSFQQSLGKRKVLAFYDETIMNHTLIHGSFSASLASVPKTKNNNIAVKLHIFKLPPKVEKLQVYFEVSHVKKPYIQRCESQMFDYNTTECIIELNRKETIGFLSMHSGIKLNFKARLIKIWFRGYMDSPYDNDNKMYIENDVTMNGNNNLKNVSSKKCKSVKSVKKVKSSKNGKNAKRVNGNHKQRKRNNKKGKAKPR